MSVPLTRPMAHQAPSMFGYYTGTVARAPQPFFSPPVPTGMREPGTNYITIITADENKVGPGSNMPVAPVAPLTRKGG